MFVMMSFFVMTRCVVFFNSLEINQKKVISNLQRLAVLKTGFVPFPTLHKPRNNGGAQTWGAFS